MKSISSSLALSLLMVSPLALAQDAKKDDMFIATSVGFKTMKREGGSGTAGVTKGGSGTAGVASTENQERLFQAMDNGGSGTAGGDHPATLRAWGSSSKTFLKMIKVNADLNPDAARTYVQDYFNQLRENIIAEMPESEIRHSWLYTTASSVLYLDQTLSENSATKSLILDIYQEALSQTSSSETLTLAKSAKSWLQFLKTKFTFSSEDQSKVFWNDASRITSVHREIVLNELVPQVIAFLGKTATPETTQKLESLITAQDAEKFNDTITAVINTIASEK